MIVYSYQCKKCSHCFTKLYSQDDCEGPYCPSCGSNEVNTQSDRSLSNYINSYLEESSIS
jgi:putative FmdB family regulatory protein